MEINSLPPPYIPASIIGSAKKFKWSGDIALHSVADKDQNIKLYDAVDRCNFRAKLAIGLAISEWIVWRFKGLTDVQDCLNRIKAGWAGAIDTGYVRYFPHRHTIDDDMEPLKSAVSIASAVTEMITEDFRKRSIYLAESVVRQAVLAQRVMPDKNTFTNWLTNVLKKMAAEFPNEAIYDHRVGKYDYSREPLVLPAHLTENANARSINTPAETQSLLESLDETNPYLARRFR